MRKIQFKAEDKHGLVFGYLVRSYNGDYLIVDGLNSYLVEDSDTICQYSGMDDITGFHLYEKDEVIVGNTIYTIKYFDGAFRLNEFPGNNALSYEFIRKNWVLKRT